MTWERFTRAVIFLLGVVLLVWAAVGTPPRWGLIALALLLLGVITSEQLAAFWRERRAVKNAAADRLGPSVAAEPPPPPTTPAAPPEAPQPPSGPQS